MKIHYFGYFNYDNKENLNACPSIVNKTNYIIQKIRELNLCCTLVNVANYNSSGSWIYPSKRILYNNKLDEYKTASSCNTTIIGKVFSRVLLFISIIFYIFRYVKKDDKVLVYHSMSYLSIVYYLKKIVKYYLIYEVEELYSAAWDKSSLSKKECQYLSIADAYIYVNELMPSKLGFDKPYVVCLGNYSVLDNITTCSSLKQINMLYAGVIGDQFSDVYFAIDLVQKLPDKFNLIIAGYGTRLNIKVLNDKIEEVNSLFLFPRVEYRGCLSGKEYEALLSEVNIGLCPRLLADNNSDYTFPSKILVYLTRGLTTVSTNIRCVKQSPVGELVHFLPNLNIDDCVNFIKNVELIDSSDQLTIIKDLDKKFRSDLKLLLISMK